MRKIISTLLALVMVLSLLPMTVWAEDAADYDPFADLQNTEAKAFTDTYLFLIKVTTDDGGSAYVMGIRDAALADENSFEDDDAIAAYREAEIAYYNLSSAAKQELNSIPLMIGENPDGSMRVDAVMDTYSWFYSNTVPYQAFDGLTNSDAVQFAKDHLGSWAFLENGVRWEVAGVPYSTWENGTFVSPDAAASAQAALDAYDMLDAAAKAELDAVRIHDGPIGSFFFDDTLAAYMAELRLDCLRYSYQPFAGLTNSDARAFIDNYIEYGVGDDYYYVNIQGVSLYDDAYIDQDSADHARQALDAYDALSAAARTELAAVMVKDGYFTDPNLDVTFDHVMEWYRAALSKPLASPTGSITNPILLTNADARAFMAQYMSYAGKAEDNLMVKGTQFRYGGYETAAMKQLAMSAYQAYEALDQDARSALETLYVHDGMNECRFSERMFAFRDLANRPDTGSKTPAELTNTAARDFLDRYIDYQNGDVTIRGTAIVNDHFKLGTLDTAFAAIDAYFALMEQDYAIIEALNELEVYLDGQPVTFERIMFNFEEVARSTRYNVEYIEDQFRAAGFQAPQRSDFTIEFPRELVYGTDYTYDYDSDLGLLTVTVSPGVKQHWINAAQDPESFAYGTLRFSVFFNKPDDAVEYVSDCGNGGAEFGIWKFYLDHDEYNNRSRWNIQPGQVAGVGAPFFASVNRETDMIAVTATTQHSGDRMLISWFGSDGNCIGRYMLATRIVMAEPFSYEASVPEMPGIAADRFSTDIESDPTWTVTKKDGVLTVRPASGTLDSTIPANNGDTIGWIELTPPDSSYNSRSFSVANGRIDFDSTGSKLELYAMDRASAWPTYYITWHNSAGGSYTETLTVRVQENTTYLSQVTDGTHQAQPATAQEVGTPTDNSMLVTYDPSLGFVETNFAPNALPAVESLNDGVQLTPPEGAKYFTHYGLSGNRDIAYLNSQWTDSVARSLANSELIEIDRESLQRCFFPYVSIDRVVVDDVIVYFASTQEYRALIVQWFDENQESLGYSYVYGKNGSFVNSVTSPSESAVTTVVDAPVIVSDTPIQLTCKRYPQEGNDKTLYLRLLVDDESQLREGGNDVYLPYSYFPGLSWELAQTLTEPATILHFVKGENAEPERLIGEYTEFGIKFHVDSFSPFTVTWTKNGQSAPSGSITATAPDTADGTGKITGVSDKMEYSADGGKTWVSCSGSEITGLVPGVYLIRMAEDDTHDASEPTVVTVPGYVAPEKAPQDKPSGVAGIAPDTTDSTGKITGISDKMEYSADGGKTWIPCSGSEITGLVPGVYLIRMAEDDAHNASEAVAVTVPDYAAPEKASQDKPSGVAAIAPDTADGTGKITGVSNKMEYSTDGGKTWVSCSGSEITGLVPGVYLIRMAEDDAHNASEAVAITVPGYAAPEKASQDKPSGVAGIAPSSFRGTGKITGVSDKMEYSADGGKTWISCSGSEITELAPGIYLVRMAEDDTHNASEAIAVTVPKYRHSGGTGGSSTTPADTRSPETGDPGIALYAALCLSSAFGSALIIRKKKHH